VYEETVEKIAAVPESQGQETVIIDRPQFDDRGRCVIELKNRGM
jgi:hypothetical protein